MVNVHKLLERKFNHKRSTSQGAASSGKQYNDEESELLKNIVIYRDVNQISYIGPTDVLWILKKLGYVKIFTEEQSHGDPKQVSASDL